MRCILYYLSLLCCLITSPVSADNSRNGELLASTCAACHGTRGHSVGGTPSLAGLDELHIIKQMKEFTSALRPSTVMFHHASGYTTKEIELMATYFSRQIKP
ncbi:MAG: cytochrome C [Gammaproteobacteria bacterium]|nr:cytochrome C [Gammaproteobacteria bacterium]MDH5592666.1 cytochrome C [Gammaproteobacteria bacterium]